MEYFTVSSNYFHSYHRNGYILNAVDYSKFFTKEQYVCKCGRYKRSAYTFS